MKKLLIYYSLSGNGDAVAEKLAETGYDIRKVEPVKKPPKRFIFQILAGGFQAARKYCEPLKDYEADVSGYDEIVIGSPVWNGRLSSPINTVLRDTEFGNRRVTFILYSGSGEAPKAEKQIRERVPNAVVVHLKEPKKHPEMLARLSDL